MTAHIEIKLFATLAKFLPEAADYYEIQPDSTVGALLSRLKVPQKKAKLIFINGVKAGLSSPLRDGDRMGIFPPVGGG